MCATPSDTAATAAEQGVAVTGMRRGPFDRLDVGDNEGDVAGCAVLGRAGERATRSEGGDGATSVFTGAAGALAMKSVGGVDVSDADGEGVRAGEESVGWG